VAPTPLRAMLCTHLCNVPYCLHAGCVGRNDEVLSPSSSRKQGRRSQFRGTVRRGPMVSRLGNRAYGSPLSRGRRGRCTGDSTAYTRRRMHVAKTCAQHSSCRAMVCTRLCNTLDCLKGLLEGGHRRLIGNVFSPSSSRRRGPMVRSCGESFVQILPVWIFFLNQIDFPGPIPLLDLLFACDGG